MSVFNLSSSFFFKVTEHVIVYRFLGGEESERAASLIRAAAGKISGDTKEKRERAGEAAGTAEDSSGVLRRREDKAEEPGVRATRSQCQEGE